MNAAGSLKINKWHTGWYTHRGSLHFKLSPTAGFNGRLNAVEKSDGWLVLGLPHEWPFLGSLRLGMVSKPLSLKRMKHQPFWQVHGVHVATSVWNLQWPPRVADESAPLWIWSLHTTREALEWCLLIKNQDLDFISYFNHMQYLEGVSGEWPMHKNVFVGIYIKLSLSYGIFRWKINLPPLWQQKEWMRKPNPHPLKRKQCLGTHTNGIL